MSLQALPVSKRNVSLRSTLRSSSMSGASPRAAALGPYAEDDTEALVPLETQASSSSRGDAHAHLARPGSDSRLSSLMKEDRTRTTVLVNLAAVMERMDEQILPALYSEIGKAFQVGPTELGYLTLSRALVQALTSPIGGIAGHYYNRIWVTACGCFIWGTMTTGFAFCNSVPQGMFFWAVNGIGLALVIPNGQSMIADFYTTSSRGMAFGALYVTSGIGAMLGSLYATNIGTLDIGFMTGWRFAFLSVAMLSILIGGLTLMLGTDPRNLRGSPPSQQKPQQIQLSEIAGHMGTVMSVPTFIIIVVQGIVGSIPWSGMVFLTLYFQLLGMSDFAASLQMALLLGSTAVGGLLGGWVGDRAAVRHPDHGRIFVCQFSVAIGIPFSLMITKVLPHNGETETVVMYGVAMVTCGLLKSWAAPACNNPIFAEIVPAHLRTLVYSFDRCFEGAIAACAAPLVGVLAERIFGFKGVAGRSGDPALDRIKANAIGNALLCFMILPWTLCLLFYCGLHLTYPADRAAALEASRLPVQSFPSLAGQPAERQRLRGPTDDSTTL